MARGNINSQVTEEKLDSFLVKLAKKLGNQFLSTSRLGLPFPILIVKFRSNLKIHQSRTMEIFDYFS